MKAENCGANCSDCPLRDADLVWSEKNTGAQIAIVTDHPGQFEVQYQRPLVGPASKVFTEALSQTNMYRGQFHITMSVLCQPPEDNMKKFLAKIQAGNRKIKTMNRKREKEGLNPFPFIKTPHECCAPRLQQEIERFEKIIPMGSYATKSLLHKTANVMDLRGSPTVVERDGKKVRILPTLHPAMVSKSPKWTVPFTNDIIKAVKWFQRGLDWTPPEVIYHPSAEKLREFLWQEGVPYWAYDVETDGIESLTANLRCIGIGTPKAVVLVGLLGIDGKTKFYRTQQEEDEVIEVLKEFFLDPNIVKMGWNSGYYDRLVMENHFGITPAPHFDAMLFHRLTESELPHSLGFAGSMYSEAPSWKTDRQGRKKAYGSETDFELHEYCLMHGTPIVLEDGSTKPIQEIVHSRYNGKVLSVVDGKIKACKVINWYDTKDENIQWYQVKFENQKIRDRGLICTHDHSLIGPLGEIEAQNLKVGDSVWHHEIALSRDEEQALLGTLMGDSSLVVSPTYRKNPQEARKAYIVGGHTLECGFSQFKCEELSILKLKGIDPRKEKIIRGKRFVSKEIQRFASSNLYQLQPFLNLVLDSNGRRQISVEILNLMGNRGLAWLYMDDGCKQKYSAPEPQNNGKRGGRLYRDETCVLNLQGFPREQLDIVKDWFIQKFGATSLGKDNILRLGTVASRNFAIAIAPYLPLCARYKLPRLRGIDLNVPYIPIKSGNFKPSVRKVVAVTPYFPPREKRHEKYKAIHRYCIDVEESHNFFTSYGLVHNCAYDVSITAEVLPPLADQVRVREQGDCLKCDHTLQGVCAEMHKVGMHVDQPTREKYEKQFMNDIHSRRIKIREACGIEGLNPSSTAQLRNLLFEDWNLLPYLADRMDAKDYLTDGGEPSTGDDVMRALLSVPQLTEQQKVVIENIRHYRRSQKMLGTYVTKLRYANEECWGGWDAEDSVWDKDLRDQYGLKKMGIVDPETNRMHPGYNVHVTVTGRLSSSKPINAQNFPKVLRSMVTPAPGNILVGADMDQLELRIAAARWKSEKYLQAFADNLDPHSSVTAYSVFGKKFEQAAIECGAGPYPWKTGTKFSGNAKKLRDLSKMVAYASQYAASVETVHRIITQTEVDNGDGTTSLPYLTLSMREVRMMHQNWQKGAQYDAGWNEELTAFRNNGYLVEPIMGRRRDFLDGENINEIVNYPIQASASSLMNIALLRLREEIPMWKWGYGTGIINQCHDAIVVECPIEHAEWTKNVLQECMNLEFDCLSGVRFTAEAELGESWKEVG